MGNGYGACSLHEVQCARAGFEPYASGYGRPWTVKIITPAPVGKGAAPWDGVRL